MFLICFLLYFLFHMCSSHWFEGESQLETGRYHVLPWRNQYLALFQLAIVGVFVNRGTSQNMKISLLIMSITEPVTTMKTLVERLLWLRRKIIILRLIIFYRLMIKCMVCYQLGPWRLKGVGIQQLGMVYKRCVGVASW